MGEARPGEAVIEVRVGRVEKLFQSLDPSPFNERDLDPDAAAFILDWARDLPRDRPFRIRVHLEEPARERAEGVASAIGTYFGYQAGTAERDLRELFAMGWRYTAIGITVLILCVLGSQLAMALLGLPIGEVIREGLIILGWVANWKPFQTFLYDWLPVRRRRDLLRRLAAARVELVAG